MAHELATMEGEIAMLYQGDEPWHKLGYKIADNVVLSAEEALKLIHADYEVKTGKLFTPNGVPVAARYTYYVDKQGKEHILGDHVGEEYTPLQNKDAFGWFQPFIDSGEARIHTAGVLRGGRRIWVLAEIKRDPIEVVKGDIIKKYILLSNGHDGSMAARSGLTATRVVCANTLAMAHSSTGSSLLKIRHTKNVVAALEAVRDIINTIDGEFRATAEQYALLARKGVSVKDAEKYVKRVFQITEEEQDEVDLTLGKRIWTQIEPLIDRGRGNSNPKVHGTLWAAYNGITEYVTHKRGTDPSRRLDEQWFGAGSKLLKKALDVAVRLAVA